MKTKTTSARQATDPEKNAPQPAPAPAPEPQPTPTATQATPTPPVAPPAEVIEQARREERERILGIRRVVRLGGRSDTLAEELITAGASLDEARSRVFDEMAKEADGTPTRPDIGFGTPTRPDIGFGGLDETVTRRQAVQSALLHRFDAGRYALSEPAREYRSLSLLEIGRDLLSQSGARVRGLSKVEIATQALHSTSDFPAILADVANKTLRDAYDESPRTFVPFCRKVTAADFKSMHRVQLGEAPNLEKVGQHGEFKRGSVGEARESYRIETFGKIIGITREIIINDDLNAFTRVPFLFGNAAARLESDTVWGIVIANPQMADGTPLFDADHDNLGAAGVISVDSLSEGRATMRTQRGIDGAKLNIAAAFMLVPAALETRADQYMAQNILPRNAGDVNPFSGRFQVIAEPRLDEDSEISWYLAASPSAIDTIEYAYLEGQEGVYIETRMGFDVDGVEVKARLDFGAKAIDWRGLWKNPGA